VTKNCKKCSALRNNLEGDQAHSGTALFLCGWRADLTWIVSQEVSMVAFIIVIAWYLCRGSYRLHKISRDAHNKRRMNVLVSLHAYTQKYNTFFKMAMASQQASENETVLVNVWNASRISISSVADLLIEADFLFIARRRDGWKNHPYWNQKKEVVGRVCLTHSLRRTFHAAVAALQFMQESFCDPCRCVFSWPRRFLSAHSFLRVNFLTVIGVSSSVFYAMTKYHACTPPDGCVLYFLSARLKNAPHMYIPAWIACLPLNENKFCLAHTHSFLSSGSGSLSLPSAQQARPRADAYFSH
jgi:hypothetical protein